MTHHLRRIVLLSIVSIFPAACAGESPELLGATDGRLAECPVSPNCVSSQAENETHHIAPLTFKDSPDTAFTRLRQILDARGDTTIITDLSDYLRVEFRTLLFVDDGEFLLDPEQRLVQVRSASRLGYSDLGKNRKRLEEIRQSFAQ
ncbi:MAG: DUF1499 domain-containing protein [Desulfopila sp.]|jgi:uncharacterized protein (DUF1499 family)|nr:DUF1499 domain-containing protein [Desulfopila sp.]